MMRLRNSRLGNSLSRTTGRLALGVAVMSAAAALVMPTALATPESDAADAINQAWNAAGGSASVVGGREGEVFAVGSGYGQDFTDGKIFYSPDTGAQLIVGAILNKYESLGGPADSDLGFPNISETTGLIGPYSRVSTFNASDKPAIFWTPDTGAWAVRGALNAAWDKLGGSAGALGVPIEDERYVGDLVTQKFTGGELSWNPTTNTFTTDPAGLADALAGLEVPLDTTTMINLAWRTSGGLGGPLGARQGEQTPVGDNGAAQGYAGGKIFYSPQTGAHAVTGAILSKYESAGGPTGDLGYPIGTESEGGVPNSRVSAFSAADKPVIFWTPDSGAIVVRGAINSAWAKLGGATGTLGVPTAEETVDGDTVTQNFSGGQISWNQATKEFSTDPAELASTLSGLELPTAVSDTPAKGASGSGSGFKLWWLAIILPALALLGLLAVSAQRRGAAPDADRELDRYVRDRDEDLWPRETSVSTWSTPAGEFEEVETFGGEDAVDTAPTRIPSEVELAEFEAELPVSEDTSWIEETSWVEDPSWADDGVSGRHSADAGSSSMWHFELGDSAGSGRRHAQDTDGWSTAVEEIVAEPVDDLDTEIWPRDTAVQEPWRPAIHLPLADPNRAPEGYFIKATTHSGRYFTPESALYDATVPEVWFASEEQARANGFVRAPE